jgi:hypothetical protein
VQEGSGYLIRPGLAPAVLRERRLPRVLRAGPSPALDEEVIIARSTARAYGMKRSFEALVSAGPNDP